MNEKASKLKMVRTSLCIKQKDLAQLMGIKQASACANESRGCLTTKTAIAYAEAINKLRKGGDKVTARDLIEL